MSIRKLSCLLAAVVVTCPCLASTTHPLLPLPTNPVRKLGTPADPNHFLFAMGGDNRSTGRGVPMPPTAGEIFTEAGMLQPAFMLWTGDTIYGTDETPGEAEAEYDTFLSLAAQSATPVFNAPGNHEIFDRPEMAALYEAKMGRLYGSFDYGNSHFIAINTEEVGAKGGVSKEQMDWLKQDMEANKGAAHIFAFMHHPVFAKVEKEAIADTATREALHKLFVQYGVKHVFSGHEHLFYKSEHDGVTYWVSGGAGAPTDASPTEGGYQHYMLFEVNGAELTGTVLQPWRLFSSVGPSTAEGARTALLSNYNDADLGMSVEFPMGTVPPGVTPTAVSTYKGKSSPLAAAIVPSRHPGVVTVRVVVPKHRSATVTLGSKTVAAQ